MQSEGLDVARPGVTVATRLGLYGPGGGQDMTRSPTAPGHWRACCAWAPTCSFLCSMTLLITQPRPAEEVTRAEISA